ncbi:ATP synthase subunit I [Romboutsia maritimum]|uniref:ATP synthase subunit I n=1 Tax=Romboutsia maritimum TaxID=2020948 RepID=A0A371ISW8_9FIRM|nr:ATP synthase subunit I [Romboutsia maritimum]RDY23571.1 ATP synthase subunit I [Romboutsia maritimum]
MNIKLQDEIKYITKGVIVFDVILMIILLITSTFSKNMLLGIIFGSIIGLLNFRLLAITIEKAVDMPVNKAQIYTASRYVLRMTIVGIVLIVSAKAPYLSIVGVAVGLLSPKFVILAKKLLIDKLKRKEA